MIVIFSVRTRLSSALTTLPAATTQQMFFFDEQEDWEWAIRGLYRNNPTRTDVWTAQVSEPAKTIKDGTRLRIGLDTETLFCSLDP